MFVLVLQHSKTVTNKLYLGVFTGYFLKLTPQNISNCLRILGGGSQTWFTNSLLCCRPPECCLVGTNGSGLSAGQLVIHSGFAAASPWAKYVGLAQVRIAAGVFVVCWKPRCYCKSWWPRLRLLAKKIVLPELNMAGSSSFTMREGGWKAESGCGVITNLFLVFF